MSYTFTTILTSDSIGDSVSSINNNYSNLDQWTSSIQFSATNYWIPLMNFYNQVAPALLKTISTASNASTNWNNTLTTVRSNSAKWIDPLIIVYPNTVQVDATTNNLSSSDITNITNWFNTNFPVIDNNGNTLYVQNQKGYVYVIKQYISQNFAQPLSGTYDPTTTPNVSKLTTTGNCITTNAHVCGSCTTNYQGYVYCSNGNFVCDGNSVQCTQCNDVKCIYNQTNSSTYPISIQALLNINFKNVSEATNISCLTYQVENCEWTQSGKGVI